MTPNATSPNGGARALEREILAQLVGIDTTDATGATTPAAHAVAERLRAAGVPDGDVHVIGPDPRKHNLVARLRGTGERRPLLLLAHLDVVDAVAADWSSPPFELVERDGHYQGRGTIDDKAMAALWTAITCRLATEGFRGSRDLILALTADEEGGAHNGAEWLLANRRDLVDAELGLNEGGYGRMEGGVRKANQIQIAEKVPAVFELVARGPGGHGSLPVPGNPVVRLASAIGRLVEHVFPARLNPATHAFFSGLAELESDPKAAADLRGLLDGDPAAAERLSRDPYRHALLRTTCVPTGLEAGSAPNVVPALARAVVDCRIVPGDDPAVVEADIRALVEPDGVEVRPVGTLHTGPASPVDPALFHAAREITGSMWPGVPVLPVMTIGATDSLRFRRAGIPMYGVSGIFLDFSDVRVHGIDERIGIEAFHQGGTFLERLVRRLCG